MTRADRRELVAGCRRLHSLLTALREGWQNEPAETRDEGLARIDNMLALNETNARALMGPSFSFEPDMERMTDLTVARSTWLRPFTPAPERPALSVIPGGAQPDERPSARYIDDSADDAPQAG